MLAAQRQEGHGTIYKHAELPKLGVQSEHTALETLKAVTLS